MTDSLPDWGDAADSAKNLGSMALQLRTDPLHLYESKFVYPLHNSLTLGEIMTGQGLLAAPVIWLTDNIPLAFNLLNFASYVLSGFGAWVLVRRLTGSSLAGLVAGMIFAFSPWHYSQYWHLALGAQHWMIFALYFLMLFMEGSAPGRPLFTRRNAGYLGLFAFFFVLQSITAGYYAFYVAILTGIYLIYYALFSSGALHILWARWRGRGEDVGEFTWRRVTLQLTAAAAACVVALLVILQFALPYAATKSAYDFKRPIEEVNFWSAGPLSLLQHTARSWLYQPVQINVLHVPTGVEGEMYPGIVAVMLALVGLASWRVMSRERTTPAAGPWLFAAISIVGLVLSFGPSLNWTLYTRDLAGLKLPYKWFYEHVPGWDSMRVPHRFALLFMLGLAICAGYGVAYLISRAGRGRTSLAPRALAAAAMLLVGAEFFAPGVPITYTPTGSATPVLYQWLAGPEARTLIPANALLLELPLSEYPHPITSNPIYLVYGLAHGRPMLNGSINIPPPGFERFFAQMQTFPSQATLDVIEGLGTQFVIAHTGKLSEAQRATLVQEAGQERRLVPVKSFPDFTGKTQFEDVVYRVVPSQEHVARLAAAIPPGSTVMLSEDAVHTSLYTNALAAMLGPTRTYFSQYRTIYDSLFGDIRPAEPNKFYDYAILYKDLVARDKGSAGYAPSEGIPGAENDVVQVFRKAGQK